MIALTSKEILAELKKLGIHTLSELKSYLREYEAYCALQYLHIDSPQELFHGNSRQLQRVLKKESGKTS